jgi:hypothetical protein
MAGYRLYYTDQLGYEWTLNDDLTWALNDYNALNGFGVLEATMAAERRPYRDGLVPVGPAYTGVRLMAVALQGFHASYSAGVTAIRSLRSNLSTYKDPSSLGVLRIVAPDLTTRSIEALFVSMSDVQWYGPLVCTTAVGFWAPDPFFYDPDADSIKFGLGTAGGVTYAADYVSPTGLAYAESDVDSHNSVNNLGDVETWPVVRINGPGNDPTIENETTTQTMSIAQHLDAGDYIDVDMDAGTVTWFDATDSSSNNIIELISAASTFWPLQLGENVLHVTMSAVSTGSIVVTWYNRYNSL